MDLAMEYLDTYVFDNVYNKAAILTATEPLPRDNIVRQSLSLFVFIYSYIVAFYLGTAGLSYKFIYDKKQEQHPKFLPGQRLMEIACASKALPLITVMTIPWILAELHDYSLVYKEWNKYGYAYLLVSAAMFIMFTDFCIYWIHRIEHHPLVYAKCHKLHHKWIVCTPYASHAFHPVDGYLQSLPYHLAVFIFPIHEYVYLVLFAFVSVWSVMIHDGEYVANNPVVNGAAHHTVHHLYFNYNYGQFTTLFDRIFGTYRKPTLEIYDRSRRNSKIVRASQAKDVDNALTTMEHKKTN
ncbi:C-5 sterol desaturase Erg3 [Coemansia reversa NRRL 1564]|uniref:C-5 sterol desaturase Erg3 n=1 Tax=Coemansia reversa (strain ATCC 12441 / NRRL 1564) TaxID=763665 RepID=A0A2G5B1J0_COERN|nr:C-5 sterol desaturase Erg3 [Coemansia reversa NRRL 1564]|eukprot:PIA12587.1 C-5 sterol desaturase Erg3 [Coemansia reversa NRRL 1564]